MKFSNNTRINPEVFGEDIPVIQGRNYYIDEQGFVSTFNKEIVSVFDASGSDVKVTYLKPITEFIYNINHRLAFKTSRGFLVTNLIASKEKYVGGFQGIAGFNEDETSYQYINSNTKVKSTVTFTARINDSRKLEIYLDSIDTWIIPLGEFRIFINDVLYNISYDSTLPNSFGSTFTVVLAGWTNVDLTLDTNYIKDVFIAGNTLYLSTRLQIIGSTPYDWSSIDTSASTVIWSEDARLTGSFFCGNATASYFYLVNYTTSSLYWIDASDLTIKQEYQHRIPILGVGSIDKFSIGIVDKESCSVVSSYVSLNTWLMKTRTYFKFNQLSAYEEMTTSYLREDVRFVQDLNSLVISSTQRASMILYILDNKVTSGCHTDTSIIAGDYSAYLIKDGQLLHYTRVEDSGIYDTIDYEAGILNYDSFIYIGSDLEPDNGGSTMKDTEILFEGKISLVDGDGVSVESSSDVPASEDVPVRTNQENPDNWWYLYSKTLRYPISYTDWIKISLMPTTKIFAIHLAIDPTQVDKKRSRKK